MHLPSLQFGFSGKNHTRVIFKHASMTGGGPSSRRIPCSLWDHLTTVALRKAALKLLTHTCTSETLRGCALHKLRYGFATQSFSFYTLRTYTRKQPLRNTDVSHFRAVRKHRLSTSTPKSFLLPFCLHFSCDNMSKSISDTQTGEVKRHLCSALSQLPLFVHRQLSFHYSRIFLTHS